MPTQITSREVLLCLNQLGYKNIDAQQLKEFVQDLKKLIKYEERKKFQQEFNATDNTDYLAVRKKNWNEDDTSMEAEPPNVFNTLYTQQTFASKAKVVPKKESVISLRIKTSRCPHKHVEEVVEETENVPPVEPQQQEERLQGDKSEKNVKLKRPKSFIRPPVATNSRSDPVALYHQYKAEWDRHKFPGEDHRTELRWAVREKLLGGRGYRM